MSAEPTSQLDELNQACLDAPDELEPQVALWRAVAELDEWTMINRGTAESPRPYGVQGASGTILCIYSSRERARDAARLNGLVAADARVELMSIPMPRALKWALSLEHSGVSAVVLDYPQLAAWTPLPNLARLRE